MSPLGSLVSESPTLYIVHKTVYEKPMYMHPEELGLSEEQFNARQKELKRDISAELGRRREAQSHEYFTFENRARRDEAIALIHKVRDDEGHKDHELFRYLLSWRPDPAKHKHEVGLELYFQKTPEDLEEKLRTFFQENGFELKDRVYNVVEMPPPAKPKKLAA